MGYTTTFEGAFEITPALRPDDLTFLKKLHELKYLIDKVLAPRGYVVNGAVSWEGEESTDRGLLTANDNEVFKRIAVATQYGSEQAI